MALQLGSSKPNSVHIGGDLPPTPPDTDSYPTSDSSSDTPASDPVDLPPLAPSHKVGVLDIDRPTDDRHVARDSRLIRLTGTHPFNSEAPLSALYGEGFLTSAELFYVRNHGAVPHVEEADCLDWEFSVEGFGCPSLRTKLR